MAASLAGGSQELVPTPRGLAQRRGAWVGSEREPCSGKTRGCSLMAGGPCPRVTWEPPVQDVLLTGCQVPAGLFTLLQGRP